MKTCLQKRGSKGIPRGHFLHRLEAQKEPVQWRAVSVR